MCANNLLDSRRQYDELTSKHIDQLRQLTKQIQDARMARDNDAIKTSLEVRPWILLFGTCHLLPLHITAVQGHLNAFNIPELVTTVAVWSLFSC